MSSETATETEARDATATAGADAKDLVAASSDDAPAATSTPAPADADQPRDAFAPVRRTWHIFVREIKAYFLSPIAYIFTTVFLLLIGFLTLNGGLGGGGAEEDFFVRGRADMEPFFRYLPYLFLFVIPAITMRMWAEERQSGSLELLLTLPVRLGEVIVAKLAAAHVFVCVMLLLTFPLPLMLDLIPEANPDGGQIIAAYCGAMLLADAFIVIGSFFSTLTRNQITAFISSVFVSGCLVLIGSEATLQWMRDRAVWLSEIAENVSLKSRFDSVAKGVLDIGDLCYFAAFVFFFAFLSYRVLQYRRQ